MYKIVHSEPLQEWKKSLTEAQYVMLRDKKKSIQVGHVSI